MKRLLVPVLLAIAYFGASAKSGDAVDKLLTQTLSAAAALLRQLGERSAGQSAKAPEGQLVEAGFFPEQGGEALLLKAINASRRSIDLAAYSLASARVAKALLDAKRRGVDVRIVVDEKGVKSGIAALNLVANAGIPTRTISRSVMRDDSYMVIDGRTVQTGSFDYSGAAARAGSANVIVIWNNPDLASAYLRHWRERFDVGSPYRSAY
jgi:phosphatidylserine/phosphatidylglycerophosphate/cardiolipin synthase-like enzyme